MAKDPAFLFYPSDFYSGTMLMSRFLKGCYMDLLIAQFNHGHLSLEEIRTVLGSDFATGWGALQKKFEADGAGKFFNERLETEMKRRNEFCSKQKDRASKGWEKRQRTHAGGNAAALPKMEIGNENGIGNEIKGGAGGSWTPPSQAMCEEFFVKCGKTKELGEKFYLHYKSVNWHMNGNQIRDWTALAQRWVLNEKNFSNGNKNRRDERREPASHNSGFGDL